LTDKNKFIYKSIISRRLLASIYISILKKYYVYLELSFHWKQHFSNCINTINVL